MSDQKDVKNTEKGTFEVWGIFECNIQKNTHKIDRDVEWERKLVQTFETIEEAKSHVIQMTRSHHSTCGDVGPNLLLLKTDQQKNDYLVKFCFTENMYLPSRRFFVGRPSRALMRQMVLQAGLRLAPGAFSKYKD